MIENTTNDSLSKSHSSSESAQISADDFEADAERFWRYQHIGPEDRAAHIWADAATALADIGIILNTYAERTHRVPCPECDKGPRDDALAVKITANRVLWYCHRCAFKGGRVIGDGGVDYDPTPEADNRVLWFGSCALWNWRTQTIAPDDLCGRYLLARGCALPGPRCELSGVALDVVGPGSHLAFCREYDVLRVPMPDRPRFSHHPPVMLALITDALTGTPLSLHATVLQPTGGRGDRRYLADHREKGGVVRIDELVGDELVIGEGSKPAWPTSGCIPMRRCGPASSRPIRPTAATRSLC